MATHALVKLVHFRVRGKITAARILKSGANGNALLVGQFVNVFSHSTFAGSGCSDVLAMRAALAIV